MAFTINKFLIWLNTYAICATATLVTVYPSNFPTVQVWILLPGLPNCNKKRGKKIVGGV